MNDARFLDFVLDELTAAAVVPGAICFEITETAAIANLDRVISFMRALKARGCRFSLDDFGTGLSSLTYLKNLPVDYVKIDGQFVRNVLRDGADECVVESIARMARAFRIHAIAERVESRDVMKRLGELGVSFAQGLLHCGAAAGLRASRSRQRQPYPRLTPPLVSRLASGQSCGTVAGALPSSRMAWESPMNATVDKLTAGMPATLDAGTRLALKRTQLSAERTLMSWIRTAFSMISFGFTIGKFLEYLANQPDARLSLGEGRVLPGLLVLIGLASLFIGLWEHRHLMVKLGDVEGRKHRVSAIGIVGGLVALLGFVAFVGLFIPLDISAARFLTAARLASLKSPLMSTGKLKRSADRDCRSRR